MKNFTLREANSLLPQIKLLVDEIKEKRKDLYIFLEKYEDELENRQDLLEMMYYKTQIEDLHKEINELIEIIESFGVMVKGIDPFLVDFPSEYQGRKILLCWKEGEEKIEYWHGLYDGFAGRRHVSEMKDKKNNVEI
ncbi:DUF2203 domain-containing protein [Hydrogenothermus marinus]|uniref:DUF2203 family protein n=1 Tax=Hydrogenothermus marinus TaxID=133270 RepID=A0A3M0BKX0_9AQUI|nr:DUF2203 domain-containing protein [Hydrogenothermus marinus]RMA97084.1 hypothetical protein CLV39_0738 [Hydrogenothermus marinus]